MAKGFTLTIEICLDKQELKGNKAARFEEYDKGGNVETLILGKGGIRRQELKAHVNAKSKSWLEVIRWLQQYGRTVK